MGDLSWMKGTLSPGCHLLHGPGFLLARLRGTRLARPIPNALANRLPHPRNRGPSNRSFIPIHSYRSPNRFRGRSYDETRELPFVFCSFEVETRAHTARCERLQVRFPNDSSKLKPKLYEKFDRFEMERIERDWMDGRFAFNAS